MKAHASVANCFTGKVVLLLLLQWWWWCKHHSAS